MTLPDRLTEAELSENGFIKISEIMAKHNKYNSSRHKCNSCGKWFKQLKPCNHKLFCKRCFKIEFRK